jgi:hypothetical protein
MDALDSNTEVVILLGNIGTGKSTLSKFLRNIPMDVEMDEEQQLIFTDGESKIRSKKSDMPKTIIPNVDVEEQTGTQVIDCAGYQDKISIDVDLLSGFFNRKIFESSKKIKILIVEEVSNLQGNANMQSFIQALTRTANLIGENLDSFKGSVGLIASKVYDIIKEEDAFSIIFTFLENIKVHLEKEETKANVKGDQVKVHEIKRTLTLIQYINDQEKVQLFRCPSDSKKITSNIRQNLWILISETLTSSEPLTPEFQITLAPETIEFIKEKMLETSKKAMENEFYALRAALIRNFEESNVNSLRPTQQAIKEIIEKCEEYIRIEKFVESMEQLTYFAERRGIHETQQREIHFQVQKFRYLHGAVGKEGAFDEERTIPRLMWSLKVRVSYDLKFFSFLGLLIEDFGSYDVQNFHRRIDEEMATFVETSFQNFKTSLPDWKFRRETIVAASGLMPSTANMVALKKVVLSMKNSQVEMNTNGGIATFSGCFVILSRIKDRMLEMSESGVREVLVIAAEKLFIDTTPLTLQHTHLKLIAPVVQMEGTYKISLSGENAEEYPVRPAANCEHGKTEEVNGVNGIAGISSGSFTLLALDLQDPDLLTVQTEGGDGGNGQSGGNGCDVTPYAWPTMIMENVKDKMSSTFCSKMEAAHFKSCSKLSEDKQKLVYKLEHNSLMTTNGGDGGQPGSAALPGEQQFLLKNSEAIQSVKKILLTGKAGQPGSGGKVGKGGTISTYQKYNCEYLSETADIAFPISCSAFEEPSKDGSVYDLTYHNGKRPNFIPDPALNQKYKESQLVEHAFSFYKVACRTNLDITMETSTGQFLSFLFGLDQTVSQVTPQDFLYIIEGAESILRNAKQIDLRDTMQKTQFLYSSMLQSVSKWRDLHAEISDTAMVAEMTLISLLDTLQCYLHGKQVVQLADMVDAQLGRLINVDKAIEQVSKFDTVASQKELLLSNIADAEKLIDKVYKTNIEEVKKQADAEFQTLLVQTEEMKKNYKDTDKILVDHKVLVNGQMETNAFLGVVTTVTLLAGIFFPAAAVIGPILSELVVAATPASPSLQYNSKVMRGVQNARLLYTKWGQQDELRLNYLIDSANKIMNADRDYAFLKDENRDKINNILEKQWRNKDLSATELAPLYNAVENDISRRISSLTNSVADVNGGVRLNAISKIWKTAFYVFSSGVEIAKTILQYIDDEAKLEQVISAVEKNNLNFKEMEVYERSLQQDFKPLVEQMVASFDSLKSNMDTQNAMELLMQRLDLKSYARKCILIVQKLTEDFTEKDEGFARILTDLHDLLDTIIDAYEQIEELRLRVRLTDFVGRMSGVACISSKDPEACNAQQRTVYSIKTNEIVGEFAHVFAAYQLVSFPFGAAKTNLLKANYLSLFSAPKDTVVNLLGNALTTIKNDLSDSSTTAQKHLDSDVIFTKFSSRTKTARPFYVWPNAKYSHTIAELLSGKQVSLMASASQAGMRNAAKFRWLALNINSNDEYTRIRLNELLQNFHVEMVRSGDVCLRCGGSTYIVGDAGLNFTVSYEHDDEGHFAMENSMYKKVRKGDVPLSPYGLWKFKLIPNSYTSLRPKYMFAMLWLLSKKADLELIGKGSYVAEGASICDSDLSRVYTKCDLN